MVYRSLGSVSCSITSIPARVIRSKGLTLATSCPCEYQIDSFLEQISVTSFKCVGTRQELWGVYFSFYLIGGHHQNKSCLILAGWMLLIWPRPNYSVDISTAWTNCLLVIETRQYGCSCMRMASLKAISACLWCIHNGVFCHLFQLTYAVPHHICICMTRGIPSFVDNSEQPRITLVLCKPCEFWNSVRKFV